MLQYKRQACFNNPPGFEIASQRGFNHFIVKSDSTAIV